MDNGKTEQPKPQRRGFGIPDHVQQSIICFIFHLGWPALPLLLEYLIAGDVSAKSIALTGFMYGVGLGVASRNLTVLLLSLAGGVFCGIFFGLASGQGLGRGAYRLTIGIMCLMFFVHLLERINRHWIERVPFIELKHGGK